MRDQIQYQHIDANSNLILSEGTYANFTFKPHYHLDYHIGMVVKGVQRQQFRGRSVLLGPGRISIMPPGEVHDGSAYQQDAYQMRTFRIAPTLLDSYLCELQGCENEISFAGAMLEHPQLAGRLDQLFAALQHTRQTTLSSETAWFNLFEPLFAELKAVKPATVSGGLSQTQMRSIREFCEANLASKISLTQLASLCGLSRFQLLRRFERTVGLTPHNWLTLLRLERACLLLKRATLTLAQVAIEVGFYDQSHFVRTFRQYYGIAPSKY
ncbi:AraC family transcriptional regulator [Neptunomonas marina]|uniref:AraC family transcriptional regulator n=1 Tax=Neptunomonas marina TaxID=1815562 RepID=A0A437Q993_9GAMM|nr:AraC family transcriptional regulator [Neptunomonas marina]RVU30999.1 AraC family transcriptional regulator [Neptunomonas marina]